MGWQLELDYNSQQSQLYSNKATELLAECVLNRFLLEEHIQPNDPLYAWVTVLFGLSLKPR